MNVYLNPKSINRHDFICCRFYPYFKIKKLQKLRIWVNTPRMMLSRFFATCIGISLFVLAGLHLRGQRYETIQALTQNCFINVLKGEEKYFFSIPDSVLDRDILVVSRIVKSGDSLSRASLSAGYPGATTLEEVIRFAKSDNGEISLRYISYERHTTAHPRSRKIVDGKRIIDLIQFSNVSIPEVKGRIIDVTKLLDGYNDILFINDYSKRTLKIGNNAGAEISSIQGHSGNIEIRTIGTKGGRLLYELNTSLFLLPKEHMRTRTWDPRLNYFIQKVTDFESANGSGTASMITRWRLEPRKADMEKYKRGELVEPAKPIVFYIDSTVPKNLMSFLKNAITDWNVAFEKAGFKNAILAREIKVSDTGFSMFNLNNSVVHFSNSDIRNGGYSTIVDPRSGEILQSHVLITTGGILDQCENYFVQASPVDIRARKYKFDDSLIGILAQGFLSHEIGHALGFNHNMIANDYTPVEKLRDNNWLSKNGHTVSIMDYARFNYVAQPGDNIKTGYRGIGQYDIWAVKWGYTYFPSNISAASENQTLEKWINSNANNKMYRFLGGVGSDDPRLTAEALSDDVIKAAEYGVKNLRFIMSNLTVWVQGSGGSDENIAALYAKIITQYRLYLDHIVSNIGGVYDTVGNVNGGPVPGTTQQRALDFLDKELFTTPEWIIDRELLKKANRGDSLIISDLQSFAIQHLLSTKVLVHLLEAQRMPDLKVPSIPKLLSDLRSQIFSELDNLQPINRFRQIQQEVFVKSLLYVIRPYSRWNWPPGTTNDTWQEVTSLVKKELEDIKTRIKYAIGKYSDKQSLEHLHKLKRVLEPD